MDLLKSYKQDIKNIKNPTELEKCLPLVIKIATAYQFNGIDIMDLIQGGNMGLLVAKKHFNPDKGVLFSTYAYSWIKKYILNIVNDEIGLSNLKGHLKKLSNNEDPSFLIAEYELEEAMIQKDLIHKFKLSLTRTQLEVFKLILEQGFTGKEAARSLNVTQQAIDKTKQALVKRFKDFYNLK